MYVGVPNCFASCVVGTPAIIGNVGANWSVIAMENPVIRSNTVKIKAHCKIFGWGTKVLNGVATRNHAQDGRRQPAGGQTAREYLKAS